MRTFRFITAGSNSDEEQNQTIACNLHLEPLDDVSSTQPEDCTCHTEDECVARSGIAVLPSHNHDKLLITHVLVLIFLISESHYRT